MDNVRYVIKCKACHSKLFFKSKILDDKSESSLIYIENIYKIDTNICYCHTEEDNKTYTSKSQSLTYLYKKLFCKTCIENKENNKIEPVGEEVISSNDIKLLSKVLVYSSLVELSYVSKRIKNEDLLTKLLLAMRSNEKNLLTKEKSFKINLIEYYKNKKKGNEEMKRFIVEFSDDLSMLSEDIIKINLNMKVN